MLGDECDAPAGDPARTHPVLSGSPLPVQVRLESAVHGYADAIVALVTHLGRYTSRPMAIDDPQAGHSREAPTSPAVHI